MGNNITYFIKFFIYSMNWLSGIILGADNTGIRDMKYPSLKSVYYVWKGMQISVNGMW